MYLLFAWSMYSPEGGPDDYAGAFETADAAVAAFSEAKEILYVGETRIGYVAQFDGQRFTKLLWLCREGGKTITEAVRE